MKAQQEKISNKYKNAKLKLLKTKAATLFNKICKTKQQTSTTKSAELKKQEHQNVIV
jgi:hypothetical protein